MLTPCVVIYVYHWLLSLIYENWVLIWILSLEISWALIRVISITATRPPKAHLAHRLLGV